MRFFEADAVKFPGNLASSRRILRDKKGPASEGLSRSNSHFPFGKNPSPQSGFALVSRGLLNGLKAAKFDDLF